MSDTAPRSSSAARLAVAVPICDSSRMSPARLPYGPALSHRIRRSSWIRSGRGCAIRYSQIGTSRWPSKIWYSMRGLSRRSRLARENQVERVLHLRHAPAGICSSSKTRARPAARPLVTRRPLPIAGLPGIGTSRTIGQVDVSDRALVGERGLVILFVLAGIQHQFSRPESRRFDDRRRARAWDRRPARAAGPSARECARDRRSS